MNITQKLPALIMLLILGTRIQYIQAQPEMQAFTWDSYSMAFSVPKSFTILENDSIQFSASDSAMNLTIIPFDASAVDSANMNSVLGQWALANNVELLGDYKPFDDEGNYSGVLCIGTLNSYNIMLMLVIDPDYADIGFYIWISYKDESFDTVLGIVDSFYPI
jgi:hypothetical protein